MNRERIIKKASDSKRKGSWEKGKRKREREGEYINPIDFIIFLPD